MLRNLLRWYRATYRKRSTTALNSTSSSMKIDFMGKFRQLFGLDRRSMALYRVLMGLTVLYDLYYRALDLRAHYTDEGVLPRHLVIEQFFSTYWMSLYTLYGTPLFVKALFIVHATCAFFLAIGYRTKLMTVCVWVLQNSINNRNILLLYGGDLYLRVMLFWSIFLPLGSCYSVDDFLQSKNRQKITISKGEDEPKISKSNVKTDQLYLSGGTFTVVMQVTLMYIFSYLPKTGPEWYPLGTATFLALSLDFFRTSIGEMMWNLPSWMLQWMTIAVWYWEGFGVLFWFMPFFTEPLRVFGVFGFSFMHLSFWSCMRLEMFGALTASVPVVLLPAFFWDSMVWTLLKTKARRSLHIYYKDNCSKCTKFFRCFSYFFLFPETRLVPLSTLREHSAASLRNEDRFHARDEESQSPVLQAMNVHTTLWVVEYDRRLYTNFAALAVLCQASPLLWPFSFLLRKFNSKKFGERILLVFIHFHMNTSESSQYRKHEEVIEMPEEPTSRFVSYNYKNVTRSETFKDKVYYWTHSIICVVLIYYVFCWNMGNVATAYSGSFKIKDSTPRVVVITLQLDQIWDMFAPRPPSSDWWFTIEATLRDGSKRDLFGNEGLFNWEGRPFTWDKPDIVTSVKRHRWFKFYERVGSHPNHQVIRLHWGRYICREWNARHQDTSGLQSFRIWWVSEHQQMDGSTTPGGKMNLWEHVC